MMPPESERAVLLDFDGTLAIRDGLWGACVFEVLGELAPGHAATLEAIRAGLRDGFPWHRAGEPHPQLSDPEAWWAPILDLIAAALTGAGVELELARHVAVAMRARFVDPALGWRLFDDTLPALHRLRAGGWRCAVLSNHVPELPALVAGLGLAEHFDVVLSSATIGYEKPHPEAFRLALEAVGHPRQVWMIGDNPVADVGGAEAAGLRAILVRREDGEAQLRAADLTEAVTIVLGEAGRSAA